MFSEKENLNIWQQGYISTDDEQDDDDSSDEEESDDSDSGDDNDDEEYDGEEEESEEELDSVIEAELGNKNISEIEKKFLAT